MGRIAGMKTYLVGAMDRAADGGVGWRSDLAPWLRRRGVFVFNPCDKPIKNAPPEEVGRADIAQMKKEKRYKDIRPAYGDWIRGIDLRFVDESSFIVCYLDMDSSPCGTYEEFFTAIRSKKPILTVCKQGLDAIPGWLWLTQPAELFFETFDDMKEYIHHVDTFEGTVDTLGRWRFFDWKRMVAETLAECPDLFKLD